MATTDLELLALIRAALIEDASFSSGLWTLAEVLRYFNQRQYRFLKETTILVGLATLGWTPGQPAQDLPPDWIATVSARWHDFGSGRWYPLPPSDSFQLDHLDQSFATTDGPPQGYRDGDVNGTLRIALGPAPVGQGAVEIHYVSLSEVLDGTGQLFDVPDDWIPYLGYGVKADMLSKEGRGQDLLRARYCEQRYTEGIVLAQSLLEGF